MIWSLIIDLAASMISGLDWLDRLSLFHYMALAPADDVDPATVARHARARGRALHRRACCCSHGGMSRPVSFEARAAPDWSLHSGVGGLRRSHPRVVLVGIVRRHAVDDDAARGNDHDGTNCVPRHRRARDGGEPWLPPGRRQVRRWLDLLVEQRAVPHRRRLHGTARGIAGDPAGVRESRLRPCRRHRRRRRHRLRAARTA